jgi:hypothetical protein
VLADCISVVTRDTGHFGTVTDSYRFGTTCKIPISVFCFV